MTQRVGPKLRVHVRYECNGCQFHKVDKDPDNGKFYHACHHPGVISEYTAPQWMHESPTESLENKAQTPKWLCPYVESEPCSQ